MQNTLNLRQLFIRRLAFVGTVMLPMFTLLVSSGHAWAAPGEAQQQGTPIAIRAGGTVFAATLNDSSTAQDFIKSLPRSMKMTRWGDREFYGKVGTPLSNRGLRQTRFANGDIAYWLPGASFAVFYDDTKNPDMSDLIVIGKITSDIGVFASLDDMVDMHIELAK